MSHMAVRRRTGWLADSPISAATSSCVFMRTESSTETISGDRMPTENTLDRWEREGGDIAISEQIHRVWHRCRRVARERLLGAFPGKVDTGFPARKCDKHRIWS